MKHNLEDISQRLLSLGAIRDSGQLISLVGKLQADIEAIFGNILATLPARPQGQGYAWGYGRQSKDDKVQLHTKTGQEEGIKEYHAHKLADMELRWPAFFDLGVSGSVPLFRRKAGAALNTHLRRGDHLIITKFDRAFRSVIDGMRTLMNFELRGIVVHVVNIGLDMSTAVGKLMVRMLLSYAEFERDMISIRTKEGLAVAKAKGKKLGAHIACVPLGWHRIGKSVRLATYVEDWEERTQIDKLEELLATMSHRELAVWCKANRFLNKHGEPWGWTRTIRAINAKRLGYPKVSNSELQRLIQQDKQERLKARQIAAVAGQARWAQRLQESRAS